MNTKTGIELITAERDEQLNKHFFTVDNDVTFNDNGELEQAIEFIITGDRNKFPKTWDLDWMRKFENKSSIQKLTIIGALAAAEIDRKQAALTPTDIKNASQQGEQC